MLWLIASLFAGLVHAGPAGEKFPADLLKCKPESIQGKKAVPVIREAAENANLTDHEVVSRLILSESLATGYWAKRCEAKTSQSLMEAIGWVILNRAQKLSPRRDDPKPTAFYDAVFAHQQFDFSFSNKPGNPYAISFLCPMKTDAYLRLVKSTDTADNLYRQAKSVASKLLETYQISGVPMANARITNVYYPYSELQGLVRPAWAKNADPTKNKGYENLLGVEKPCAEFYRR